MLRFIGFCTVIYLLFVTGIAQWSFYQVAKLFLWLSAV